MAFPLQFGSPTPVVITDGSGNSGTSANLPVIDASVGATNAAAPVYATEIGWVDGTGKLQAVSAANPLPTTSAGGGGGNVTITGPLGQSLAAASVPVVLTAAQITTLTPPAAITNFANETGGNLATIATRTPALGQALAAASVPVILPAATVTTLTPPTSVTVTQGTGTNLHAVVDSGTISITGATGSFLDQVIGNAKRTNALQVGGNDGTNQYAIPLTSGGASVAISAVSLPLPTSAAQETGNLATLVTQTRNDAQIVDLLAQVLAQLKYTNMLLASSSQIGIDDTDAITASLIQ